MKAMTAEAASVAVSMAAFERWKKMAFEDIRSMEKQLTPEKRFKYPFVVRETSVCCCMPFLCFPCVLWSCLGRLLCCCQPNAIYVNSDNCLFNCYKASFSTHPETAKMFKAGELSGVNRALLWPVWEAFFAMMDKVAWKYHMLDWLDEQLKLFGFKFNPQMLTPANAKEFVEKLMLGVELDYPVNVGDRVLGCLKETTEYINKNNL